VGTHPNYHQKHAGFHWRASALAELEPEEQGPEAAGEPLDVEPALPRRRIGTDAAAIASQGELAEVITRYVAGERTDLPPWLASSGRVADGYAMPIPLPSLPEQTMRLFCLATANGLLVATAADLYAMVKRLPRLSLVAEG